MVESGIATRDDVLRFRALGADAFLVGEALVRAADPGNAVRRLTGRAGVIRREKERT